MASYLLLQLFCRWPKERKGGCFIGGLIDILQRVVVRAFGFRGGFTCFVAVVLQQGTLPATLLWGAHLRF